MAYLTKEQELWCEAQADEAIMLLRSLGRIPAPSLHEERRAEFVKSWLNVQGAKNVYVDEALNVVLPLGVTEHNPVAVIMAHTDIVFPDTEDFVIREEGGRMYAPGIGDDTANLVALMMAAKYAIHCGKKPEIGVLIVANAGEEGLGNLKGSKRIMEDYSERVRELISIDGDMKHVVNKAVGSVRMKITVRAEGGHSYGAYGNTNAIVHMARVIQKLYEKTPPTKAKTTYNVGVIEGGTTVNTICDRCSILYEYRSEDRECLQEMSEFFDQTIQSLKQEGLDISVEVLGVRPCTGDVDENALEDLSSRMAGILKHWTGEEIAFTSGSTDANSALAIGVPAVTIGAVEGGKEHTREEWINIASLTTGLKSALSVVLAYFK